MSTEATTSADVMVDEVASALLAASALLESATTGIPLVEDAANHLFRAAALAADAAGIDPDESIARFVAQANRLR